MKQRIIIKNFGPIKDVDLEIDDFMVFIGPQASGKSTIAKLIYFFKSVRDITLKQILKQVSIYQKNIEKGVEWDFSTVELLTKDIPGLEEFIDGFDAQNFQLKFVYAEGNSVSIEKLIQKSNGSKTPLLMSDGILNSLQDVKKFIFDNERYLVRNTGLPLIERLQAEENRRVFNNELAAFLFKCFGFTQEIQFITASRSGTSNGFRSEIDILTNQFVENIKHEIRFAASKESDFLRSKGKKSLLGEELQNDSLGVAYALKAKILKGDYVFNEDSEGDEIVLPDGHRIPLESSSSGQQEAVWIVQNVFFKLLQKTEFYTVIEEPEAHLYPEAQRDMVNLISLLANSGENQVLITTHSPYILAAVNNLMFAHKVGQQKSEEVANRIDRNLWLDYQRVGAYYVGGEGNEGRIKRIMDDELHLIQNQYLDGVSQILNEEFDYLYELDEDVS